MTNLSISIVTPSYNQGKYIGEAVNSVLDQEYDSFEHIIFDNQSEDNTIEVLSQFEHVKLTSESDAGQSDAINKGFLSAKGDIIGWLNADDYYLPETFKKVNCIFQRNPDVHAIYSNVKFVDAKGEFLRNLKTHKPVRWMTLFYTYIQSTSFFMRRSVVEDGHFLDKNLHLSMDMEYFSRLMYLGYKFKHVNDYFASFRWHTSNKSSSSKTTNEKNLKEIFYILNKQDFLPISHNLITELLYKGMVSLVAKPIRQVLIRLHRPFNI